VPEYYTRKPNTQCLICKKPIYRRPSEISSTRGNVFCSRTCYGVSQRKEIPCLVCGTPILSGLNKNTCSRACANINRTGISYKQGSFCDKALSQRRIKVRLMRERGASCERCGYAVAEILHLHHKDRDRSNNTSQNLEILCPNCHFSEHLVK
jgi:5-methylcytosine-specific restriction endonuclease McrA